MSGKVLIVDDDVAIRKLLSKVITTNGLEPQTACNGTQALELIKSFTYKLILLDINMTDIDGFYVIKKIRQQGLNVPIIVVSGRNEDYDALYGLDLGADDYIMKPFNPVILGAKVKALIRRNAASAISNKTIQQVGPFQFNNATMKFYKNDIEIVLSSKESQMMKLFLDHPGQVYTKDMLYEQIWGDCIVDENAIMVYISHLRNKIEQHPKRPKYLLTVWGVGYQFVVE
ncbi:DNA-binding response OmpR family regulator [Lachnotalea glycerini]|uniref:Stage 0 sporulation protein A homolog n=1 Tax=Lachnotalea glycerini TaxID=1763509 RepID=A0A318EUB0_9FIRM|nr:response regulator transcription factor [Lachnotalea glycerini]PXV95832.1 DNA-binding response OmpR family regulator [Lachnotalea glycerini]RDY33107.1 DNA-binding response regulator [Lachnotalea glycerini]